MTLLATLFVFSGTAILAKWGSRASVASKSAELGVLAALFIVLWYSGAAVENFGYPSLAHALLLGGAAASILAVERIGRRVLKLDESAASSLSNPETLAILFPVEPNNVPWRETILGSRSRLNQQIQVLILSGDGKWYVQNGVEYSGYCWQVEGYFGEKSGRVGEEYQVVAVETSRNLGRHVDSIPNGAIHSNVVKVFRDRDPKVISARPNKTPA